MSYFGFPSHLVIPSFESLKGYAVFWQRHEHTLEMWISRHTEKPRDKGLILSTQEVLNAIVKVYPIYLSGEMRIEHHKAIRRWKIKRTAFMVVPHIFGLAIVSALSAYIFGITYQSLGYLVYYISGAVLSHYATRKFGVMSANVFFFLGLYFAAFLGIVVLKRFSIININSSEIDAIEFLFCLLLGIHASNIKYTDTVGDLLGLSLWGALCRMYTISVRTTSVVTVFTYASLEIVEYVTNNVALDSSLLLLPLGLMVMVAVIELARREVERE